jgi:hypothetical protein
VAGGLALEGGVVAGMGVGAAAGAAAFPASVEQALAPAPRDRPDAIVVTDNLAAREADIACRHLPACSPHPDPVEQAWSKPKARPRAEGARSRDAPEAALGPALDAASARDARGWSRLCGHPAAD